MATTRLLACLVALWVRGGCALVAPRRGAARVAAPRPAVTPLSGEAQLDEALAKATAGDLVAVKYYASWCKACKTIAPRYKRLSDDFGEQASFYEVEFSANKDLCRRMEVKKLPCVQFFRGDEKPLETMLCGPKSFDGVRSRFAELAATDPVHDDTAHPDVDVEFTDVKAMYNNTSTSAV